MDRAEQEQALRDSAASACRTVRQMIAEPKIGVAVILFTFEPGFTAYASNGDRNDMKRELRTILERMEIEDAQRG